MSTPRLRIGQLLVDAKLISAAALEEVLAAQKSDGRRLGTLLVERGLINETQLTQILSHQLAVPWVSLLHIEFSRQLLNLVPREVADRYCLVPIYVRHVRNQGETLYVAMDDPSNEEGLKACRDHSGLPVRAMIAPPTDIRSAIRVYYGVEPTVTAPRKDAIPTEPPPPEPVPEPVKEEVPLPPPAADAPIDEASDATLPGVGAPTITVSEETEDVTEEMPVYTAPQAAAGHVPEEASAEEAPAPAVPVPEAPVIEAVEIDMSRAEKLRGILGDDAADAPPPPSSPPVENIPRPRGRAPRMVALTLLDGTTIPLPAKRRPRRSDPGEPSAPVAAFRAPPSATPSEPPGSEEIAHGMTARDLVLALRVVANGGDASEVLGSNVRWEALFSALLSLMLKKHLIADWEFVEELKKQL